ncbi:ABC transporter permease subunit [Actinocrispum sp. NPDC049592]|uniref:ABC transporter permease subunit n=1 Tax=Actinocrispum sp. NPDC049592 TaxID=3154835 RepID=UPI00344589EE
MIWLTWRQLRASAVAVYALVAALCVAFLVTARPSEPVLDGLQDLLYNQGTISAVYLLPALIGVFWGAPMVARELEAGTHRLVWNQSVTRSRWLATKLAVAGLAAAAAAGLYSLVVTWWTAPGEGKGLTMALNSTGRITPFLFSVRGLVPVGYAVFALVLGVVIGVLLRRTVAAMAAALAIYIAVQILMPLFVRPHLIPPVQQTVAITAENTVSVGFTGPEATQVTSIKVREPEGAWILTDETVDATGAKVDSLAAGLGNCPPPSPGVNMMDCYAKAASDHGYRQLLEYQPAGRFWALQTLETAIFLALSGLLTWLCFRLVRHRVS